MKKLITILAALMVSAVAQAVAIDWVVTPIYSFQIGGTDPASNADRYLAFLLDDMVYAQTQAVSDIGRGDLTFLDSSIAEAQVSQSVISRRGIQVPDDTSDFLYVAVFNSSSLADATAVYVTDLERYPVDFVRVHHKKTIDSQYDSSWLIIGSAIPEPTSGLLILLGVAALALRKKK